MADGYAVRVDNLAYAAVAERYMDAVGWLPGASAVLPRAGKAPGAGLTTSILTSPDRVSVTPGGGMMLSTPASGATSYRFVVPAAVTKSFATRPGAGTSRIDLLVARIYDAGADVSTALKELDVELVAGTAAASPTTPALPNGTILISTHTVPNSGAISNVQAMPRTTAAGGTPPVLNATDLGTLTAYDGLTAYQEDIARFQGRMSGAWRQFRTMATCAIGLTGPASAQSVTTATNTLVDLTGTPSYAYPGISAASSVVTIGEDGVYAISGLLAWNNGVTARTFARVETFTVEAVGAGTVIASDDFISGGYGALRPTHDGKLLTAGTKLRMYAYQASGSSQTIARADGITAGYPGVSLVVRRVA